MSTTEIKGGEFVLIWSVSGQALSLLSIFISGRGMGADTILELHTTTPQQAFDCLMGILCLGVIHYWSC